MGVSINGGTSIAGWFISWKILLEWMIWGYPCFRKPPYILCKMTDMGEYLDKLMILQIYRFIGHIGPESHPLV